MPAALPRYDPRRSYRWNYDRAPEPESLDGLAVPEAAPVPGGWRFCGLPAASPLGVPAGPLLNGRWALYYARLGFDVLTYKTVRSRFRPCYALPNLQPVRAAALSGPARGLPAAETMAGSWAISFGMPSMEPEVWRRDVEWTRRRLPEGKLLAVSVVGTMQPGWGLEELAADYARCAAWAAESGADVVEANLSCPNVASRDGQLYQQPAAAAAVAGAVRAAAGGVPVALKIGCVTEEGAAADLVEALAPHAAALSMTNCIAATVSGPGGRPLFGGEPRGIGGQAIRDASIAQVRLFREAARQRAPGLEIVGVGGVETAADARRYLEAGASAVQVATALMVDPAAGLRIRREWSGAR